MARGVIALLGSGETAPGMTKVHRRLLARHNEVVAVNLDSPYGFQENVEQVTSKLVDYFDTSLHTHLRSLALPSYEGASDVERAIVKHAVRSATYVFAGPGSPSYALAQWQPLDLVSDLRAVLENDSTVCFSSAAVLTLGSHTAPIYEIYKVGSPANWLEGMDLLADLGLSCAAIPHFDNAEGRNYDTRYCYLGERRLIELEDQLPDHVSVLGIDEHTAAVIDVAADTLSVTGRSHAHWRHHGTTTVIERDSTIPLEVLRLAGSGKPATTTGRPPTRTTAPRPTRSPADIDDLLERLRSDSPGPDTTGLIEGVLALRRDAKANGDFAAADALRRILTDAGISVSDTPEGTTWSVAVRDR